MTSNKRSKPLVKMTPATPEPPLIIDLPDGQKLVIGQIAAGSVIEVATWRGTGRPDSRTSRLMLGMSPGSLTPTVVVVEDGGAKQPVKKDFGYYFTLLKSFPKSLLSKSKSGVKRKSTDSETRKNKALSLKSDGDKSKRAHFFDFIVRSSHEREVQAPTPQDELNVDKWLREIRTRASAPQSAPRASQKPLAPKSKTHKALSPSNKTKKK